MFDGEIDKGCGNQVFDYGKVIPLQTVPEPEIKKEQLTPTMDKVMWMSSDSINPSLIPPLRSETRLVNHTPDPTLPRPVIEPPPSPEADAELPRGSSSQPSKPTGTA